MIPKWVKELEKIREEMMSEEDGKESKACL